jgi:UDP-N-acetylglucosamine 2-epimerase
VESGMAILVGNSGERIVKAYDKLTAQPLAFDKTLYGDGKASSFIVSRILEHLTPASHV